MAENKQYIEMYCPVSGAHGLITTEKNNGMMQIVNFYGIDEETAEKIVTEYEGELPPVSSALKACISCGKRKAGCCDGKKKCIVPKGELWFQCLYCRTLEVCRPAKAGGPTDVYFLLDESGSMSKSDRVSATAAVRSLVKSLEGQGNTYSFVAWGSTAGYLFAGEKSLSKMESALRDYEADTTGYGGGTAADVALRHIIGNVQRSKRPARVIFVTDGGFNDHRAAIKARNELLGAGDNVEILALGIPGAIESALKEIGTVPEFSKIVSASALTSTFEDIAKLLSKKGEN